MGRPEGKRPLGRPRRRWEDNIKMDLREAERRYYAEVAILKRRHRRTEGRSRTHCVAITLQVYETCWF